MKYSLPWLINRLDEEVRLKYLFFWGHQPRKDGQIGESCFSQWWGAPFTVENVVYKTAEHWMMAEKARLFGDEAVLKEILRCKSPGEAKKWGRQVRNFDAASWTGQCYDIVRKGNFYKFAQNQSLKSFLIQTGERILVEASPVDAIWGIGLAADHPNRENPVKWPGRNLLGFALMEVRDMLKNTEHRAAE
ncbi:NADAR family protein [Larkinella rosea]|uniref:NADAR family protein n=1 Tax=Larkinella rosea TaxID=2025312 RepID=A0A3P1C332_9BACT|nr:NADAR family protein [Larkinella rosea]RRB07791.1 NADAR family protein [Larkinella rosea]